MNQSTDTIIIDSPAPPLLEIRDLVKSYGQNRVLDKLSIKVERGGVVGLLGPNGCGKSTLIKLICGLLTQDSGDILINGLPPSSETAGVISYLPDTNAIPLGNTVKYTIRYFADFFTDFDTNKAYEMLKRLDINPKAHIRALSKGNKEKLQLILTMSRNAQLYVLDEPLGGVDPAARDYILETILTSYNKDAAVIITTHLVYDIQDALDDVIFMKDGRVALCSSVSALRDQFGKTADELFREVYKC